jgi:hypothetical protein
MTDLRTEIRDALRDDEDERLSVDEAAAMRRFVVASVAPLNETGSALSWLQPLAGGATLVAMIAVGIAVGHRLDDRAGTTPARSGSHQKPPADADQEGARQLHFSTPGGTRIIWVFNSDLELKTTP